MTTLRFPSDRVCVVLLSGIGDVVQGLPLVNALKDDDPARQITWVVESGPAPLLRLHPAVDRVITFDRRRGWSAVRALWARLRPLEFDLLLNANLYFKSAVPTFIARAEHKVGFGRDRAGDLVWLFADHRLPANVAAHRQEMYLEFADYLGLPVPEVTWRITLTGSEREAQRAFFTRLGGSDGAGGGGGPPVAGIVASSAMPAKDWPVDRFAQLATALARDLGYRVLLLGGPALREQARARAIQEQADAELVWALGDDLRRLVWLIDGCDLVIAPDTGPLHIARALDCPVIGLYGHTDPRRAGPYRAFEDLVVDRYNHDAPGRPHSGPTRPRHPARAGARTGRMELITVADVLERVERARERYAGASRSGQT